MLFHRIVLNLQQHCNTPSHVNNPVLIRVETRVGHGAGMPSSYRIEQAADVYAFLYKNLGMSAVSNQLVQGITATKKLFSYLRVSAA